MKTCSRCKTEKELSEYQVRTASRDGFTASCKSCLSEYDKKRAKLPHRVQARLEYSKTDVGRERSAIAKSEYRKRNPVKYRAHTLVGNAIREGKLFKMPCEKCCSTDVHAHHDDYAKPLNIRWLCPAHHKAWHDENGEGLNAR